MLQIKPFLPSSAELLKSDSDASFARPLELLSSCHDKILHFSSALVTLSTTLQTSGWNDQLYASAEQIRRYFNVSGPEHHLDEEQHLFPAIIALDPEFKHPETMDMAQLINRLIREHVESDLLWEALDTLLAEQSQDYDAIEEFSHQFADDMQTHVELENDTILPFAQARLSEVRLQELGRDIARRRGISLPQQSD